MLLKRTTYPLLLFAVISYAMAQQTPQLVIQSSHTAVDRIEVSRDEAFILSYGDGEFKLWEYGSGRLLACRHAPIPEQIGWGKENPSVFFTSIDESEWREILEWNWHEDTLFNRLPPPGIMPWGIVHGEKENYFAGLSSHRAGLDNNKISLILTRAGSDEPAFRIRGPGSALERVHGLVEDKKILITEGQSENGARMLFLWDINSQNTIYSIDIGAWIHDVDPGIRITQDGKHIVILGKNATGESVLTVYLLDNGLRIARFQFEKNLLITLPSRIWNDAGILVAVNDFDANRFFIRLLDLQNHETRDIFNFSAPIRCFQMNEAQNTLLIGSNQTVNDQSSLVRYYLGETPIEKKGFQLVEPRPAADRLLPFESKIPTYQGSRKAAYGARAFSIAGVYGSSTNSEFMLDVSEKLTHRWSVLEGMPIKQYVIDASESFSPGFHLCDDGYLFIQYTRDGKPVITTLDTRQTLQTLNDPIPKHLTRMTSVSRDRGILLVADDIVPSQYGFFHAAKNGISIENRCTLRLYDAKSGKEKWQLAYGRPVFRSGFSRDGSICYASLGFRRRLEKQDSAVADWADKNRVQVWDSDTGTLVYETTASVSSVQGEETWISPTALIAINPDRRRLAFVRREGDSNMLFIVDIDKKQALAKVPMNLDFLDCAAHPGTMVFTPAGDQIIIGMTSSRPYLRSLDAATGELIAEYRDQAAPLCGGSHALGLFQNGRYLVTVGQDYKIRTFDTETNEILVSSLAFRDGNWITWSNDGYFQGTVEASEYVKWRYRGKLFTFEQFEEKFHQPERIGDILQGKHKVKPIETLPIPPTIRILEPEPNQIFQSNRCFLNIEVQDDIEISDIQLFLNGRPIIQSGDVQIRDERIHLGKRHLMGHLALLDNNNTIEIVAYDNERNRSSPAIVSVFCNPNVQEMPRLYLISIGVGDYQDPLPALHSAVNDAVALRNVMLKQQGKVYREIIQHTLIDTNATKESILSLLENLPDMDPEDIVILFMAGHGVQNQNGIFYFCAHGTNLADLNNTALSWAQFQDFVANLRAGKVILFLDTCHSGDILGRVSGDRFAEGIAKHSAIVFTSCKGIEYSIEDRKLGHGLFTYALLEGLKGDADLTRDGRITMSELKTYVEDRVPSMARTYQMVQTPFTPRLERYVDFQIATSF